MFDLDYKPVGGLCSWQALFEEGGAEAATSETAAASEATMAAENAALTQSGATAADVVGAGQAATAAQLAGGAGAGSTAFQMPSMADLSQGMQIFNQLRNLGPQPTSTFSSLAPATATPTTSTLPGTGSAPTNPADTKGQESWWKGLISGTGQGKGDQLPASIQDNINKQASLVQ
jgi:hypothetical protein